MAYLSSPDLAPNAFVFTEEHADALRQAVHGWLRDGTIVEIPTRGPEDRTFTMHFGRVTSVDVSALSTDNPKYATSAWYVESLNSVRVIR